MEPKLGVGGKWHIFFNAIWPFLLVFVTFTNFGLRISFLKLKKEKINIMFSLYNAVTRSIDLPVELLFPFLSPFSLTEVFVHFSLIIRKWRPNFVVTHIVHFQNYRICSSFSGNTVQRCHFYLKIRWRRNEKWEAWYKNSNQKSN